MSLTDSDNALLMRIAAQVAQPAPVEVAVEPEVEIDEPVVVKPWHLAGFGAKSRILTSFGFVPMEALRRRDPIKTFDGRFIEVQHVDEIRLDRRYLIDHPEAQPIFLPRASLGANMPNVDMYASGAQRMRQSDRVDQSKGVAAADMIGRSGIARKSHGYFTYYTFHCGKPCIANIDGVWCEIEPMRADEAVH